MASEGRSVIACSAALGGLSWRDRWRTDRFLIDAASFSHDFAALLGAGVTAKDGLQALARRDRSHRRAAIFDGLLQSLSAGRSLSDALRASKAFPDLLIATVAASEQTGDVAHGLQRYALHQQSLQSVRDKVVAACIYPLLLLLVSTLVVLLLLGVVIPRFATLVDLAGRDLPFLSRVLMDWGAFVAKHPMHAAAAFVAIAAIAIAALLRMRNAETRRAFLARIPGIAAIAREFQLLQLYRTAAILTSRGIPIHKALPYGSQFLNPSDQTRLQQALAGMRDGVGVSAAMAGSGLSDPVAASMLAVAEKSGTMSQMLERTAELYQRQVQTRIDLVSRLVEPALMVVFGLIIGTLVILMYIPIFDLASSIG